MEINMKLGNKKEIQLSAPSSQTTYFELIKPVI
jgi:hypothetical protein